MQQTYLFINQHCFSNDTLNLVEPSKQIYFSCGLLRMKFQNLYVIYNLYKEEYLHLYFVFIYFNNIYYLICYNYLNRMLHAK